MRYPVMNEQQLAARWNISTKTGAQPCLLFRVSSIPETGIEPSSVAPTQGTPIHTHSGMSSPGLR